MVTGTLERLELSPFELEVPGLTAGIQTQASVVVGKQSRKKPFEQLILLLFGTSTT
jgi:hypothetical protein